MLCALLDLTLTALPLSPLHVLWRGHYIFHFDKRFHRLWNILFEWWCISINETLCLKGSGKELGSTTWVMDIMGSLLCSGKGGLLGIWRTLRFLFY
jgi:hypothetical protein